MKSSRLLQDGFTLVELLVVIAIVGVLVSLLLPTLGASRDVARGVKCLANLRQTHHGFSEYANANKTHWVVGGYNHNVLWSRIVMYTLGLKYTGEQTVSIGAFDWNAGAGDQGYGDPSLYAHNYYSKSRKNLIMKCPAENFLNNWLGENATSYRFNTGYSYGYGLGVSDDYTTSTNATYRAQWGRIKDHQLEKPSGTFVIGDGIIGNGSYEYTITNLNLVSAMSDYHNGGANFLFTDGHAGVVMKAGATSTMFDRRR